MIDRIDLSNLKGTVVITRTFKDGKQEVTKIDNLVVNKAREVIRNLVFGDTPTITKLSLGNCNLNITQALNKNNIPNPNLDDTRLTKKVLDVNITTKEKTVYGGRFAIKYNFFVDYDVGNSTDPNQPNFFTEAGLALEDSNLFTRLTFLAITKDSASSLSFDYYLVF